MATPLPVFKKKNTFAEKMMEPQDLKLGMQTQLDCANNMGWVSSGHTSSFLCARLKMPKIVLLKTVGPNHVHFCFKSLQHIPSKRKLL